MNPSLSRSAALSAVIFVIATRGLAADGVLEINETCAYSTGCFPGDAPLLPVTISAEGSYRLTSNLPVGGANVSAIEVAPGAAVDIDLNGFVIQGITSCVGIPATTCNPAGSGAGVSGANDVAVRNGTIRGMGSDAIRLTWSARVENVSVVHNALNGIRVGQGSLVRGSLAASNGERGISADLEARVVDNLVSGNGEEGIFAASGAVTGNTSARNGGPGGRFGSFVAFSGNSFTANVGGSVAGGAATGGNVCDDGKCTRDGRKRFYASKFNDFQGDGARSACVVGFRMAFASDLHDPSALAYDGVLGFGNQAQQTGAPTSLAGWVRTGYATTNAGGNPAGEPNCLDYTSQAGNGTVLRLESRPSTGTNAWSPWVAEISACSSFNWVWCIEE